MEKINMIEIAYNIAKSELRVLEIYANPKCEATREMFERKRTVVKSLLQELQSIKSD